MHRFTCIFFHVRAGNIDGFHLITHHNFQPALGHNRQIELADLIAFGQIGIEIVFAVKHVFLIDFRTQRQTELDGLGHHFTVHHRQHARQRTLHHARMRIRLRAKRR